MSHSAAQEQPVTLETVAYQLAEITRQQAEILRQLTRQSSPWLTPGEACEALGLQDTASARRKLQFARERGLLKTFGQTRPYTYSRSEIEDLRRQIEAGKIFLGN